jgi:hypothetical protein
MQYLAIIVVMILIYLFLKHQTGKTSVSNITTNYAQNHKETNLDGVPFLDGPGTFSIDIVGESHYQNALNSICGGKIPDGHNLIVHAELIHEDNNPYDRQAIRIDIHGMTVGYFSKKLAREYRQRITEAGYPGVTAVCDAMIVGGWKRGENDEGHYGVKLDLPEG